MRPCAALAPYIDAYWTIVNKGKHEVTQHILPDNCVDIIVNRGEDCITDNGSFRFQHEAVCFVGTMTGKKDVTLLPATQLTGIRFKPAAFAAFYEMGSLHEVTDHTIELDKKYSTGFDFLLRGDTGELDGFLLNRLQPPRHSILPAISAIHQRNGMVSVDLLAKEHFMTTRQLERYFRRFVGLAPKAFINLVRFHHAMAVIQQHGNSKSLMDIAFDCGYYDHAHLANEIKRYTGLTPSQL